jgi:hypothetical protein
MFSYYAKSGNILLMNKIIRDFSRGEMISYFIFTITFNFLSLCLLIYLNLRLMNEKDYYSLIFINIAYIFPQIFIAGVAFIFNFIIFFIMIILKEREKDDLFDISSFAYYLIMIWLTGMVIL